VLTGQEVTFWLPEDAPEFTLVEWDIDYDGTFIPAPNANDYWHSFTYSMVGNYTVAARVTEAGGATQIITLNITVETPPPIVTVAEEMTATVGTPVTFSADVTAEAGIDTVEWGLAYFIDDDEEYYDYEPLSGSTHTFVDPGEYWVLVTVTDNAGKTAEGWIFVTVNATAPTATVSVSGPTNEGQPVTFTLSNFDPNLLASASIWVNWTGAVDESGAGIFEELPASALTTNPDGSASFTHVYTVGPGGESYEAVVYLEDEWGEASEYTVTVTINDVKPQVTLAGYHSHTVLTDGSKRFLNLYGITMGSPLRLENIQIATEYDASQVTYHWEFDGVEAPDTNAPIIFPPNMHPGKVYEVRAWITDKGGTESTPWVFTLAVDGSGNGPSGGTAGANGVIFGTVAIKEDGTAENYGRFNALPRIGRANWDANQQTVTVETHIEPSTRDYAKSIGATFQYQYLVSIHDVEEHTFGPPNNILLWSGQLTPTTQGGVVSLSLNTQLPPQAAQWAFHTDRKITVIPVVSLVMPNGTLTNPTTLATVTVLTLKTQTTGGQIIDAFESIRSVVSQLADKGQAFLNAVIDNPDRVLRVLLGGFGQGVGQFVTDMTNGGLMESLWQWLGGGAGGVGNLLTALQGVDWGEVLKGNLGTLTSFLLQYSGLTVDHIQDVVRQQLGAGNLAALETVLAWFQNDDGSAITDPKALLQRIKDRLPAGLLDVNLDDPAALANQLWPKLKEKLAEAGVKLAAQVAAKFVPGAGAIMSVYNIAKWVIDNQAQLQELFQNFLQSIDALSNTDEDAATATVKTKVREALQGAVPVLLGALASQFGLGNFPNELRKATQFIPIKVDAALQAAVAKLATVAMAAIPGGSLGLPPKIIAQKPFTYPDPGGKQYLLYAYQDGAAVKVEIAEKITSGWRRLAGRPLDAQAFTSAITPGLDGQTAKQHMRAFADKAKKLSDAARNKPVAGTTAAAALKSAREAYTLAETRLLADIAANACVALNAGCFAAGTKLLTKRGWLAVEDIAVGDELAARHESEPAGEVAWQPVEAYFRRTGRILHLHFPDGELIRTTPEHPFFVEDHGWTPAGSLKAGNRIVTLIGDSVPVSEVFDTGEWEVVYNIRVAEYHTYFVGDEHWGFAAWAHNMYADALDAIAKSANSSAMSNAQK
jgi:hypothetical protein